MSAAAAGGGGGGGDGDASGVVAVEQVDAWYERHREEFSPPVCNRLLHKGQLSVMFVGGPNTRTDFHLDLSSEFFWQRRGRMELPIVEKGERKLVEIKEGEVFLLPSRVPHSPQRPEAGSLGLVIERSREPSEIDGLRWYVDFETCNEVLYEHYFHCGDLGRDLVPVVKAYHASEEFKTRSPTPTSLAKKRPWEHDVETAVPRPFALMPWIEERADSLARGEAISLFGDDHPDKETRVWVVGGRSLAEDAEGAGSDDAVAGDDKKAAAATAAAADGAGQPTVFEAGDTWLYMIRGSAVVSCGGKEQKLDEDWCCIVPKGTPYSVRRDPGSIGFVVTQDWMANKPPGWTGPAEGWEN